jgi:hypothetical protein
MPSSSYTCASLLFVQLTPLLFDQPVQLVQKSAVVLAYRVNDAREQRFGAVAIVAPEQSFEYILGHAALELLAR